jgi:hypothetical protein
LAVLSPVSPEVLRQSAGHLGESLVMSDEPQVEGSNVVPRLLGEPLLILDEVSVEPLLMSDEPLDAVPKPLDAVPKLRVEPLLMLHGLEQKELDNMLKLPIRHKLSSRFRIDYLVYKTRCWL